MEKETQEREQREGRTQAQRRADGELYFPFRVRPDTWTRVRPLLAAFNASEYWHDRGALNALRQVFGQGPEDLTLVPPFFCDHGSNLYLGRHFFANTGLTVLDEVPVRIGDDVYLGPHVSIYTACHPIDAAVRNTDLEYARPVTIGDSVWVGGNVVINPGVTIGSDVVIGSGSVVTRDIPSHVVAAGNPCRVIRPITEEDHAYWQEQYRLYVQEMGEL